MLSCVPPMSMMLAMLPASPGPTTMQRRAAMVWSLDSADCCPMVKLTDSLQLEFSQDITSAGELGRRETTPPPLLLRTTSSNQTFNFSFFGDGILFIW